MLRSAKEITGYTIEAKDGTIGKCKDILFDEEQWTVRYMVADTGKWLPGRKVLISPISLGEPRWDLARFPVNMTKAQIENAPPLDADAPISRKYERQWTDYYGWGYYWGGPGVWGIGPYPNSLAMQKSVEASEAAKPHEATSDMVLRSAFEVTGYHIAARDGKIGHVEDFIIEDKTWVVRYMIVDTRNWLPGRKVLVSPQWIESVVWADQEVHVGLDQDTIKNSPEYNPSVPVNRQYEERLYDYYGRPRYWF